MSKRAQKFLKLPAVKTGGRCRVCADARVAADVADWAVARAAGSLHTLNGFFEGFLLKAYSAPPCRSSVRLHVQRCLGLHPSTALPLHEEEK